MTSSKREFNFVFSKTRLYLINNFRSTNVLRLAGMARHVQFKNSDQQQMLSVTAPQTTLNPAAQQTFVKEYVVLGGLAKPFHAPKMNLTADPTASANVTRDGRDHTVDIRPMPRSAMGTASLVEHVMGRVR